MAFPELEGKGETDVPPGTLVPVRDNEPPSPGEIHSLENTATHKSQHLQ